MTRIVASLVERSVSGVSRSSKEAFRSGADIVEVRLDHLRSAKLDARSLADVRDAVRGPAIATLRSDAEGGLSALRGTPREEALRAVLDAGFEYMDLELGRDRRLLNEHAEGRWPSTVVASHHFKGPATPGEVARALSEACEAGDIGKVAMPCEHAGQAVMLARLAMKRPARGGGFTVIGMGDQGRLTRVCASQMGSAMVYCSLPGKPAAPGQLDVRSQAALERPGRLVLGLIGHPVEHSVSKPMQEAALGRAGLEGTYLNLDLPCGSFTKDVLETLRGLGFTGLNVTIPHKETAWRLCDVVDPEADAAGAVNTITFSDAMIYGKNTDIEGFIGALKSKKDIGPGTNALVFGAGGAARAAILGLRREGAHVTVAARDPRKAERLGNELVTGSASAESLRREDAGFDLVVNCTPAGMKGVVGTAPLPSRLFKKGVLYFDMVYNPPVTRAMKTASARGAEVLGGLEMLVRQGAASFESWTGDEPDIGAMRSAARRALR